MTSLYDPDYVRCYYDAYGEREWARLEATPQGRASFHVHRWHLRRYIAAGDRVLDVGAGPGRFTIELAMLGATVTVGDLSPGQLELNRQKVRAAGYEDQVAARHVVDVVDLGIFPDRAFDAVVCFGGPLSYVFDRADAALEELLRVTRPGGHVLLSVMSLVGNTRQGLPRVLDLARQHGPTPVQRVLETGDLYGAMSPEGHPFHLFRRAEVEALLRRHACAIEAMAASNCLSVGQEEALRPLLDQPELWEAFLGWELACCQEPGAVDGGSHLIAVVRRAEAA